MASRQGGPDAERAPDLRPHRVDSRPELRDPGQRGDSVPVPTRDPSVYSQTDHFHERLRQPGRYVSLPAAGEAIERGQLRWNSTDGWRFALVRDGIRFIVVVSDTDTASPVLVTGWTEVVDQRKALRSPRWSSVDIETIQLRSALSADRARKVPERIRPRDVSRPFAIGGHRVTTGIGEGYVQCVECEVQSSSKRALCECRCDR